MILAHSRGGQGWAGQVMRETKPPPNEDWRLTKNRARWTIGCENILKSLVTGPTRDG